MNYIDIKSGVQPPFGELSNFTQRTFPFKGYPVNSIEAVLQAIKYPDPDRQLPILDMWGITAKRAGRAGNKIWKPTGTLYWMGKPIDRFGEEYQLFLDDLYTAVTNSSTSFRRVLLKTGDATLDHSIGKRKQKDTVLTRHEFISRLHRIRTELRKTQ